MSRRPNQSWQCAAVSSLLVLLLLPLQLLAQDNAATDAQQAAQSAPEPERFTMNMREADIRGFIQWVADRTQRNIIVHRNVRGNVTVISSQPVTPDEAYELFLTVLQLNGFAAVDSDGAIKVVPDAEAKTSNIPFAGSESRRNDIVTAIIHIKHSDPGQIMGVVRPLMPASAYAAAYPSTNALIVADTAAGIQKIRQR